MYLLECALYKIQYVGKCETTFNIQLNNHRQDEKRADGVPASKHFNCNRENNRKIKLTRYR